MKPLLHVSLSLFCLLGPAVADAAAAAMAAADQVGGYSNQVLEKVSRVWQPPADPADRTVRIRVSVDADGKVSKCQPVASSALAAMDKSACAAVREAEHFGVPPYGMPIDVYLTFWTGRPGGQSPVPTQAEAAKTPRPSPEEIKAREVAKAREAEEKYVKTVMEKIRPHVIIPAKTPKGKYTVVVQVHVNSKGMITQVGLAHSGGDALLDNSVMRAVTRTGTVPPPPAKKAMDLNLTFVVKRQ
mgnify:FL=1